MPRDITLKWARQKSVIWCGQSNRQREISPALTATDPGNVGNIPACGARIVPRLRIDPAAMRCSINNSSAVRGSHTMHGFRHVLHAGLGRQTGEGIMKQRCVQLMVGGILMASAGPAVAADKGGGSMGSSNPVHQSGQSPHEQRKTQQTSEQSRDGRKLQEDTGSTQGAPDKPLERDHDRLRELEQELTKEPLRDRDRDGDRLQGK